LSRHSRYDDDLERAIDERPSDHNYVAYVRKRVPRPLNDRDFLGRLVWKAQSDGFVVISTPTSTVARPHLKGVVRAEMHMCYMLTIINDSETRVDFVVRPDFGGRVPATIVNRYMAQFVSYPTEIQEYYQKVRPISTWDEKDGRAVGEALLIKVDAESKKARPSHLSWEEARMRALFAHYRGLKEAGERYKWFEGMLARVLKNRIR
jgi:hypothetical protein